MKWNVIYVANFYFAASLINKFTKSRRYVVKNEIEMHIDFPTITITFMYIEGTLPYGGAIKHSE